MGFHEVEAMDMCEERDLEGATAFSGVRWA